MGESRRTVDFVPTGGVLFEVRHFVQRLFALDVEMSSVRQDNPGVAQAFHAVVQYGQYAHGEAVGVMEGGSQEHAVPVHILVYIFLIFRLVSLTRSHRG